MSKASVFGIDCRTYANLQFALELSHLPFGLRARTMPVLSVSSLCNWVMNGHNLKDSGRLSSYWLDQRGDFENRGGRTWRIDEHC